MSSTSTPTLEVQEIFSVEFCPHCTQHLMIVSSDECACLNCLRVIKPNEYIKCTDFLKIYIVGEEKRKYFREEFICWHCLLKEDIVFNIFYIMNLKLHIRNIKKYKERIVLIHSKIKINWRSIIR